MEKSVDSVANYVNAIKAISMPNIADGGYSWLMFREPLKPNNRHQRVVTHEGRDDDGEGRGSIWQTWYLKDEKTGAMDKVFLNDVAARVQGRKKADGLFEFYMLEACDEDDVIKWQLMDTVCELADKCEVDITMELDVFAFGSKSREVMNDAEKRLLNYHDFTRGKGSYLLRRHKRRLQ